MNFKHLIIVSLILAILTMGVVCASDDAECNDTLSQSDADTVISENTQESSQSVVSQADEGNDDIVSYIDDEDALEAVEEEEDTLGSYKSGGVEVEVYTTVDISDEYDYLAYVNDENGLKGTVTLKIDGKKVFSKKYTDRSEYYLDFSSENVNLKKFGYGYHTVKLIYNDGKEKTDSRKVNFVAIPTVDYPDMISEGEQNGIRIIGEKLSGTATIYKRIVAGKDPYGDPIYKKGDAITTVKIKNGYGWIPLNKLTEGTQNLQLEYSFGTYSDVKTFSIEVKKNSREFKSSLSADKIKYGKSVTVKLKGPKATGYGSIYIDNEYYKSERFNYGILKESISGLKVGKHHITLTYTDDDSNLFYSATYKLLVKHDIRLKLEKVKVKKSAKKIVIKARLKIDGKLAKNRKVKFKFNDKKYTAKTDKNGIAKITIKKKIIQKLKKGKTIEYEVAYGKYQKTQKVKVK